MSIFYGILWYFNVIYVYVYLIDVFSLRMILKESKDVGVLKF
jgi:hypothetical protein